MPERFALSPGRRLFQPETEELEERTLLSGFTATTDNIHIWMDQLGNLSPQMTQFLATHVDGTQKQTPSQIAALQAINPNFGLLNYRLGTMSGTPMYIINGQWSSDFSMVTTHEDWFAHMTYGGEPQSAADLSSGRIRDTGDNSYAMDISNVTWQNYWLNSELQNLQATGANGTFVDSFTYGVGGAGYDSPPLRYQGTNAANPAYWPGGVTWTDQLANWAQTIENAFGQYNAAHGTNYKFIPNLDARVTSWEPNWYYQNGVPFIDGAFLEGFGEWTDTYDWRLSMNRGLDLTRNDKIVIMQPYTSGSQQQIDFLLGTYLLLKGDHTYLAINGTSYYPEYQLDIGAPITAIPSAASGVDGYLWNGVYRRDFQNGFVLVNPGTTTYTLNLGGTYRQVLASGGGALSDSQLDANGNYIGGSLSYQNVGSITLVGASSAIFLNPTTTNAPPTVTANPTSQTVTDGQWVSFMAAATGTPAPTVQWQVSTDGGSTFTNISGATSTTYSFTASTGQNGYQYRAVFTNTAGSATTKVATLTVDFAPTITSNPGSQTVNAGQSLSFTAAATGNPTPTVQWEVSTNGGSSFSNIVGATSTTLTFTTTAAQNGNQYRAVFTNSVGSATTTAATLTVNSAPTITSNPTNQSVSAGQPVSFTAAAGGNPVPTVQWQVRTNGGGTFSDVAGATSTTLSFTTAASLNGNQYRAVFTNSAGSATTTAATLTVTSAPVISGQPSNVTITTGQWASFSVTATGAGTRTYQWQKLVGGNWVAVSDGGDITGSQSPTLNFSATAGGDFGQYRVLVSNGGGTTISNAATLANASTSFFDDFNRTDSATLGASWQIPSSFMPTARRFQYRRRPLNPTAGFQVLGSKAVSLSSPSSPVAAAQVVGMSSLNATLQANIDATNDQAVGLFARAQSNGQAYVARLTHSGTAEILLYNGATNTFRVLGSAATPGGATAATLQFRLNGSSLSLFLNGSSTALVSATDSTLTTAGGVGLVAWGANGSVDNFSVGGS
jgi:hypothetical protein